MHPSPSYCGFWVRYGAELDLAQPLQKALCRSFLGTLGMLFSSSQARVLRRFSFRVRSSTFEYFEPFESGGARSSPFNCEQACLSTNDSSTSEMGALERYLKTRKLDVGPRFLYVPRDVKVGEVWEDDAHPGNRCHQARNSHVGCFKSRGT